jgi:hypothetical protein
MNRSAAPGGGGYLRAEERGYAVFLLVLSLLSVGISGIGWVVGIVCGSAGPSGSDRHALACSGSSTNEGLEILAGVMRIGVFADGDTRFLGLK